MESAKDNKDTKGTGCLDLAEGRVWAIDKPLGWSSFYVVKKLRGALLARVRHCGVRKLKVGHAGTLDPLATGVMVICLGKATKQIDALQSEIKEYETTLQLGATTPSFDLETPVDATYPTAHIDLDLINKTIPSFVGVISQVPPAYSACNVGGKRAYKMARAGHAVDLKPRTLVIDSIEVIGFNPADMTLGLRIVCSKGTYIRALARDIGQALGSGAYLAALRRTRVGEWPVSECVSVDEAVAGIYRSAITVTPVDGQEPVVLPPGEYVPSDDRRGAPDRRDILSYPQRVRASAHSGPVADTDGKS